jgi:hypothetical protein
MLAEFPGPQRGDKVLLVNPDQVPEMVELIRSAFDNDRVRLAIVPTVAEAIGQLSEPFDLLWLRLPLPDLQASLFIEHLLARPDLADRVGIEDMVQAMSRLSKMPALRNLEPLGKKRDKWIWVRVRSNDEREWVQHLLEQCMRKDAV